MRAAAASVHAAFYVAATLHRLRLLPAKQEGKKHFDWHNMFQPSAQAEARRQPM